MPRHSPIQVGLALLVAVAACTGPGPSQTPAASAPGNAAIAPSASAPPSAPPSAAPDPSFPAASLPPIEIPWASVLEIVTDGVAVRRGPSLDSPPVTGARWDASSSQWVPTSETISLMSGDRVRVDLGPIRSEGYTWYQVWSERDSPPEQEIEWDADGDHIFGDDGWITTSDTSDSFVRRVNQAEVVDFPPVFFGSGGSGAFLSEPFKAGFVALGTWALAPEPAAQCDLRVTIEPTGDVLQHRSRLAFFEQGRLDESSELTSGEFRVRVEAGDRGNLGVACPWAVRVARGQ